MTNSDTATADKMWEVTDKSERYDDPLLDCLELLAKIHDRQVGRSALRARLPLVNNRLTVELVPRAARRAGLAARTLKRPLNKFYDLQLPAILLLKDRRACVAQQVDHTEKLMVVIWPESGGTATLSFAELEKEYTGYAIFIKPKFKIDDRSASVTSATSKNWFWKTLFSSWKIYRDVLVASFLINCFALATPFFIINVYDRIIPNAAFESLWVLSSGILVIYLFELLIRGLRGFFIDAAGQKANIVLSSMLFEKVLNLRMEARPKSVGAFTKKLQQFENIRNFITSISITALVDLPFALLALLAIWYIGQKIVVIHVIAITAILLYAIFVQIPLQKAVKKTFKASSQKNAILVEGLSGLETIKILGAESKLQRAWEESVGFIAKWSARSRFLSTSVSHIAQFVQSIAVVAVIIMSIYTISRGEMTSGGLIACIILTRRSVFPMTQVVGLMTRFHEARNSLRSLDKIMQLPSERPVDKAFLHRSEIRGEISLSNISFAYPGNSTEILRNINIQIQPGERVGIIGPIGSGKTTLGKLILGLYEPTKGMVALDGTDIRQIDPAELRRFIGYVPQDVVLFRGTIKSNITLGAVDVDDTTVLRVAEIAGVSSFVNKHPLGYDMVVEEQGRNLSGGQRQSIALARAILLDPPVLILDEPTSAMDNRTESAIREKLQAIIPGKALIIITHRTSLLDIVDRVVVVSKETIVADGTKQRIVEALKQGHISI